MTKVFHSVHLLLQLCELGIDLRYQLDGLLRSPLQRALNDARDKAVEAVKLRATEDKWRPTNLGSKDALTKFVMETGLSPGHMQKYVQGNYLLFSPPCSFHHLVLNLTNLLFFLSLIIIIGESWIALSASTVALTRQYLSLLEDCLRLCTTELVHTVDQVLTDVYSAQLLHFEGSLQNDKIGSSEVSKCLFIKSNLLVYLNNYDECDFSFISCRSSLFRKMRLFCLMSSYL